MPQTSSSARLFCSYKSKPCKNLRAIKPNGQNHTLCEFHRVKANANQRKLERKKRGLSAFDTDDVEVYQPQRKLGYKELWLNPILSCGDDNEKTVADEQDITEHVIVYEL